MPRPEIVPIARVLAEGWYFVVPFAVLIGGLFWFNLSPETAALYASVSLIACGLLGNYRGNAHAAGRPGRRR